ncbi:CPBP family intramembrane metalloprotease [Cytobacillus suaedae]|nr:CPBP family intramembrane metalloprotease [Cytobacillus suaedae]
MLSNLNLTSSVTKKDIGLILIITILVDLVLYFTKYSSFMFTLYDLLLMITFYVGIKLHRVLSSNDGEPKDRKSLLNKFVIVFIAFYCAMTVIDALSYSLFESYWDNHEQYVEDSVAYVESAVAEPPTENATAEDVTYYVFSMIDSVGYEFLSSILAGTEEIWRLGYMILILLVLKAIFQKKWESGTQKPFMITALVLSSFLFGWGHTLSSHYDDLSIYLGTVILYSLAGLVLGSLLLWAKNLWILVAVHSLYDVLVTISWYYFNLALEVTIILLLIIYAFNHLGVNKRINVQQQTY